MKLDFMTAIAAAALASAPALAAEDCCKPGAECCKDGDCCDQAKVEAHDEEAHAAH